MGYRSDVVFAFYPGEAVRDWVDQHWPKAWCEIEEADDLVLVRYSDVKWYEDFEFVQDARRAAEAFEREFEAGEYETARGHWEMARIGEDESDVERDGSPFRDFRLAIRRGIEVM